MRRQYWARAPRTEIATEILAKYDAYVQWMDKSGYRNKIQELYNAYYNFNADGGFTLTTSPDGAITKVNVNHFKNLIQRIASLTTQSKLSFVARATNSDAKSQLQSDFARGLLEYYNDEKGMDATLSDSVLASLIKFEAFIYCPWNFDLGREVAPTPNANGEILDGAPIKREGDQEYFILGPHEIARSVTARDTPYFIIRQKVNKWDLVAKYEEIDPELAEKIACSSLDHDPRYELHTPFDAAWDGQEVDEDMTYKYILIHKKTPALPTGRVTEVCAGEVLEDDAMYYKTAPVVRMSGGEVFDTIAGDTPAATLLAIQQAIDALSTAVLTNNMNFAMQNIWSTTPVEVHKISQGQNNVVSASKPEALQLTNSSPETFKLIDGLKTDQQVISGMNATTRGTPDPNVKTAGGQALAIAQAIQFVDEIQRSYAKAAGEVGTITVHNLQEFCDTERIAYIGGQSKASYVKSFTSDDIRDIDRVIVDLGSPMLQNLQGRYALAQEWSANGQIQPKAAVQFLRTGELDSETEDDFKDAILIREENEALRRGEMVKAAITDNHVQHIMKHRAAANDPAIRDNPVLLRQAYAHIQEHIDLYKQIDPDLAAILGLQPLPSQVMAMQAPPAGPQQDQGGAPQGVQQAQPIDAQIAGQSLPSLPAGTPPQTQADYEQLLIATQQQGA